MSTEFLSPQESSIAAALRLRNPDPHKGPIEDALITKEGQIKHLCELVRDTDDADIELKGMRQIGELVGFKETQGDFDRQSDEKLAAVIGDIVEPVVRLLLEPIIETEVERRVELRLLLMEKGNGHSPGAGGTGEPSPGNGKNGG